MELFKMRQWGETGNLVYHESTVPAKNHSIKEMEVFCAGSFEYEKSGETVTEPAYLSFTYMMKERYPKSHHFTLTFEDAVMLHKAMGMAIAIENERVKNRT